MIQSHQGSLHRKGNETPSSGYHFGRVSHRNNHKKRNLQNCSYDSAVPEVCWLTGGFPAALVLLPSPNSKLGRSISVSRSGSMKRAAPQKIKSNIEDIHPASEDVI